MQANEILKQISNKDLNLFNHSDKSLADHLIGTYEILSEWEVENYIALAGLCHSVYGTESYTKNTVPLTDRSNVQSVIGIEAEKLVYYFGCHNKASLWVNLDKSEAYKITDRFTEKEINITLQDLKDLVTITLANWLEQRPRVPEKYLYLREKEFTASKHLLSPKVFNVFLKAYKRNN